MDEKKKSLITLGVVVLLIAIFAVIGIFGGGSKSKSSEESTTTADDSSYTSLNFVDFDTLKSSIQSGTKAIYVLGQTTCGYCSAYKPIINEVAQENNVTFNYININTITENQYNELSTLIDYLGNNSDWGTPLTLVVENGKTIDTINGYTEKDEVVSFLKENGFIGE